MIFSATNGLEPGDFLDSVRNRRFFKRCWSPTTLIKLECLAISGSSLTKEPPPDIVPTLLVAT